MMSFPSLLFGLLLYAALPWTEARSKITVADLKCKFTLAAVNLTLPNANSTGAPLVLGQAGAIDGESFEVSSTYYSYPYDDFPALELVNNSLRAYQRSGRTITNATVASSGETLNWETSSYYSSPAATSYSAVWKNGSDEFAVLAAYEITHLWSLCPFFGPPSQTNVVFNVSADIPPSEYLGFDPADCYPVKLNIVPAEQNVSCIDE